jgi:MoxR-like ATPase
MTNTNDKKIKYDGKSYKFDLNNLPIDSQGRVYRPYYPEDDLIEVVNLAIDLERPLLIDGVPGCGKTELAQAIAYEFTQEYREYLQPGEYWPWDIWNVKSTEQASDGLYSFDAISKLRDAQLAGAMESLGEEEQKYLLQRLKYKEKNPQEQDTDTNDKEEHPYIKIGKFGEFLKTEYKSPVRPILLIDEIDKADADFPNDLLMEIEKGVLEIKETGKKYSRDVSHPKPIIIIASNQERPLSDAFLRRCIYFHLEFPGEAHLKKIIRAYFPQLDEKSALSKNIITTLADIRGSLDKLPGAKLPGTSEVLDLVQQLQSKSETEALAALAGLKDQAKKSPLLGILIKTKQAQDHYRNISESGRK